MRTERGGRAVYHALAALLFAAVCAWSAAALCRELDRPPDEAASSPEPTETAAGGRFRGVLARDEERLAAGAFPGREAGARLSAFETGGGSALWFPACDGWEFLTPAALEALSPEELAALLDAPERESPDAPRLVYGFTLGCAALFEGDAPPAPGLCRLRIEGQEAAGRLLRVTTDALGRTMLLLRLTEFPQALYERRFVEGEIAG